MTELESDEWRDQRPQVGRWRSMFLLAVAFGLYFAVRQWFPVSPVPEGTDAAFVREGLAILVFAGFLWFSEAMPLAVTGLLVAVMSSLGGRISVQESFVSFAHPIIFLLLGGFGLASALSRHGLDEWIVRGALRIGRGHFYRTALVLFLFTGLLSMWISNTATTTLIIPIGLGLLDGIARREGGATAARVTPFLLLGIAYSASVGGLGMLTGTAPNGIAAAQLGDLSFLDWMKVGLPCVAILFPLLCILLLVYFRPGRIAPFEARTEPLKLTGEGVATLVVFGLTITCWLFSRPLAEFFGVEKSMDSVIAIGAVVLLAATGLVGWKDIDRTTDWGVLILFGGGITLSKILGSTGASLYLAETIRHYTAGWPLFAFVAVLIMFVIFLTELTSNTATTALFVPIFAAVAPVMGVAESQLVLPIAIASSCAFMLPIATPPNAIAFATGRVTQRQMVRVGLVLNVIFAAVLTLLSRVFF
ncbi:MAG: DASS family sodium-coupled anion symporter [Verrucomicrobiota bacterium]